jgi:hypothetical protein
MSCPFLFSDQPFPRPDTSSLVARLLSANSTCFNDQLTVEMPTCELCTFAFRIPTNVSLRTWLQRTERLSLHNISSHATASNPLLAAACVSDDARVLGTARLRDHGPGQQPLLPGTGVWDSHAGPTLINTVGEALLLFGALRTARP